jgi:hypothetical protein
MQPHISSINKSTGNFSNRCFARFQILFLEVISIRLRRTKAQWSANIRGGLQASDKCSQ